MSLNLQGVSFAYPKAGRSVLDAVELTLPSGGVCVLLGANGSGKSTLLSLASGRKQPTVGGVFVDGRALAGLGDRQRAQTVAFLPQTERVPFAFSCLEFALFGSAHRRSPFTFASAEETQLAREAFATLGITALETRPVTEVSQGELQLVRLARCMVQQAPWLLLDEPTAMLDPAHVRAVGAALAALSAIGRGILLSTHDLAFATQVAQSVCVLQGGQLTTGTPDQMLQPAVLERTYGITFDRS